MTFELKIIILHDVTEDRNITRCNDEYQKVCVTSTSPQPCVERETAGNNYRTITFYCAMF